MTRPQTLAAAAALAFGLAAFAGAHAATWSDLPDWSGRWAAIPAAKAAPPYNAEWAAKQRQAAADLKAGKIKDPRKTCGLPLGNPWMLSAPDIHEWILRPEEVWHSVENGSTVSRAFTDQPHMSAEDIFPTYTGDSTAHWEGETLVIDTIALRDDTWLGPGALIHSDKTAVVQRLHKVGANLVDDVTVNDPVAFAKPWHFVQSYRRLPAGGFVHDWACKVVRDAKG